MHADIRKLFTTKRSELKDISDYYFDGSGKSIRPLIICTLARALNNNLNLKPVQVEEFKILQRQRQIALIAEMIHVASLIHDDIIDGSDLRRGKNSVNEKWGCHKAVLAGDYVLGIASQELAKLESVNVVDAMSSILDDLVKGELMQLGTKDKENERFQHYTLKTYRKTASLIANSCKSVAYILVEAIQSQNKEENLSKESEDLVQTAFECGKNVGIAFQLIDDVLDFTSQSDKLGKPGFGADLRLGLATAPVLFAATKYPELNSMIKRRFTKEGDVIKALELVLKSDGIKETRFLAQKYCENAESILKKLKSCGEIEYLKHIINTVITREK